jgi:hypothetical protein
MSTGWKEICVLDMRQHFELTKLSLLGIKSDDIGNAKTADDDNDESR